MSSKALEQILNYFSSSNKNILSQLKTVSHLCGGALLVAGTCIGAGMLGLPVSTAASGFYPTVSLFVLCWSIMTLTAFLMLEVSLWFPNQSNLISMAKATLGKSGEVIAWIIYVLFLYSLMAAYTAGGGGIAAQHLTQFGLSEKLSLISYVLFFALIVYSGTRWVDFTNRIIMLGLLIAYFGLVYLVTPHINSAQLHHRASQYLLFTLPLMVTSFGFHLLIPSLKYYFKGNVNQLRIALFIGSLIPLVVYLAWEWIILGAIPLRGDNGLLSMLYHGNPAVELSEGLKRLTQSQAIPSLAKGFSFFAILSSFIGVALGLFDFFADGLKIKRHAFGKILLTLLTFIPPALFAYMYPTGFLYALNYAGIFAAILLIIYPALMVWWGRYHVKIAHGYQVAGGRLTPIIAIAFGISVILMLVLSKMSLLPIPN